MPRVFPACAAPGSLTGRPRRDCWSRGSGTGLDIDELPVPRLVIVTINEADPPDYQALRRALQDKVRNASLDDHRNWVDRLVTMARTTVSIGLAALILILSATILTVVFATRERWPAMGISSKCCISSARKPVSSPHSFGSIFCWSA